MFAMLAAAAVLVAPIFPAAPQTIDGGDPKVLEQQLSELGYAPKPIQMKGETAQTDIDVGNSNRLTIVLGGCTANRDCSYAVALGVFNDVRNPPAAWVAKANVDFDLIKVWLRDDGALTYSDGAVIDGLSRASFRKWIDGVKVSAGNLANRAITDKLNK